MHPSDVCAAICSIISRILQSSDKVRILRDDRSEPPLLINLIQGFPEKKTALSKYMECCSQPPTTEKIGKAKAVHPQHNSHMFRIK
jgi:hypothetical protein